MGAPLLSIDTPGDLPPEAEVVVIGGGIIGTCAAYYLAQRGVRVVLLEKGRIGAEQSSRNWGWCRQQNRDARELPVATRSLDLWEAMAADIGADVGFRRCGLTYLSDDQAQLDSWAEWRRFAIGQGVETHMLSGAELEARAAATGRRWQGGVWSPTDGTADPSRACPVIAQGVQKFGGTVVQMCAARGIETSAGRVSGVITEKGVIRTAQVVMAGGAWASSFCRQLGISFPQASMRSSILSLAPGDAAPVPDALYTPEAAVTRRTNGGYTVAISGRGQMDPTFQTLRYGRHFLPMFFKRRKAVTPGGLQALGWGHERRRRWALDQPTPMERARILDPRPSQAIIDDTLRRVRKLLPALAERRLEAAWAGYIDSTPDGVPVIGEIPALPGFVLAAGFSGHGFGIGPGAGLMIADLVTGRPGFVDMADYRLSRFASAAWGKVAEF
ncbi:Glycine/D-amino acid oxidase [Gemmobacter megaterium]|uniref:Glycine/D-amino acid oxidase n=1 Tax=Gemmobacter megaterium TaxID=1086013 RepID=A0A1N7NF39_9RHOB|nr:FAD-binding oxidoreductase [Gemmobacter megaterium]GGE14733.1 D-amino-acid oxidase [Gemmobacter megaterium]SIS96926.1 Glycine/D-amino acid oxidase [Gemmobacter megaterium]